MNEIKMLILLIIQPKREHIISNHTYKQNHLSNRLEQTEVVCQNVSAKDLIVLQTVILNGPWMETKHYKTPPSLREKKCNPARREKYSEKDLLCTPCLFLFHGSVLFMLSDTGGHSAAFLSFTWFDWMV